MEWHLPVWSNRGEVELLWTDGTWSELSCCWPRFLWKIFKILSMNIDVRFIKKWIRFWYFCVNYLCIFTLFFCSLLFLLRVGFNAIKLKDAWLRICLDFLIMNCCLEISRTFFVCIYWLDKKRNLLQIFFTISRFIQSHNLINQVDLSFEDILDITRLQFSLTKSRRFPWRENYKSLSLSHRLGFHESVKHCTHTRIGD